MVDDANPVPPGPSAADDAALRGYAEALADGVERHLGPWVERVVAATAEAWRPGSSGELAAAAAEAGRRAAAEVGGEVRTLLLLDVDAQPTGPLAALRGAVRFPTEVLAAGGVAHRVRDEFSTRAFPDDVYDLAPASFADLHPDLHEPGLVWGAAKAHVVLARRRAEGLR